MKKLKYSSYKIFHFKDKIDSLSPENNEILPPIHIRIKPTNKCNHNCWYCAYRVDNLQLGKDMKLADEIPEDKMVEIIDDCIDMGVKAITFSGGGEPLIYPHILNTLKKLLNSPIKFATLTNGSNLKDEIAEIFAYYGSWVRISIDGWDDESYSKFRNIKRSEFSKILKNIEQFKKLRGKCSLGISFIIDNLNYSHICEFVKKVKDAGVDSIKMSPCIVSNNAMENNNYHHKIFKEVKEQIEKAKMLFENEDFEIFDSYHLLEDKFDKNYQWCPYLQILPVIGADCGIYPCHDKAYNKNALLGNIKLQSFKKWWFNNKEKFFKINPSIDCKHHCVANPKNRLLVEYFSLDKEHLEFV